MTHEVRRNDGEAISQTRDDVPPGPGAAGDAVKEQESRPISLHPVGHVVAVDRDVLELTFHGNIIPQPCNPNCVGGSDPALARIFRISCSPTARGLYSRNHGI